MSSSLNETVVLVPLEGLPPDSLHACDAPVDGENEPLILYRDPQGGVRAWLNVCPHAGRRLDWAPGQFLKSKEGHLVCAAHGASFALDSGDCIAGPCKGDRLRAVPVDVRDGKVYLA